MTRDEREGEKRHTHTLTHIGKHIPHTHTHPPIHPKNQQRNSNVKCLLFKLHKRFVQTLTKQQQQYNNRRNPINK